MGYYTVLTPCVVGQLHYAHVPSQPIKADDTVAADLVASGALAPYLPAVENRDPVPAESTDEPATPARSRRRRTEG